ncbi:SRPBCC family protein [Clostridium hydrogenum]|uniref:polyketide cyclase n=1 Tax=Clostridium hydrogenum TaxID=2855764 RepID=UPI001F2C738A|nr:polyketide cyclase [Clostridium hydrogenum]
MKLQFKVKVDAPKEVIWSYYADPTKRKVWEEDLESIKFNGEVETGTTGTMKLKGMPEMDFTLINIVNNAAYWDRTDVPGMGSLIFGHDILQEGGETFIQHSVTLDKENPSEEDLNFLSGVFSDVPSSVMKIKKEVEI